MEGFAQLMTDGKLPEDLERPAVIEISLTSLVAEALLGGKITDGQTIRLVETDGKIHVHALSPPQF